MAKHMSSTPAGLPIPWDDWKGDGMIMEETDYIRPFVLGTRVLFGKGEFDFEVCDFSLWGCTAAMPSHRSSISNSPKAPVRRGNRTG